MRGWLKPVGPEPAVVYWIRRGVLVLLLIGAIVAIGSMVSQPRQPSSAPVTPSQTPTPEPSQTSAQVSSLAPITASPEPTPEPPAEPVMCRPAALTLAIDGTSPVNVNGPTTFTVSVTSTEPDCLLDLAANQTSVVVTSGSDRIWSTADCADWQPTGTLHLLLGAPANFEVGWPVKRSAECSLVDTVLGAGTYVATVNVGTTSSRFVMQLQG